MRSPPCSSFRLRLCTATVAALTLLPLVACVSPEPEAQLEKATPVKESPPLPPGTYGIQSIVYDDADGGYRLFLLDAPASHQPLFTTTNLRMARLSDEEIAAGVTSARLDVDADGPIAKLPSDFGIQYTHNVTETVPGGPDGAPQTVVVRQESSTWSPFFGVMAGMAVGHMLFSPMYYYPPPYMRGAPLTGFGGSGASRVDAQSSFVQKHGTLPQSAKLSQSGYAKAPASGLKSTGKGAGSSRLGTAPAKTARPKSSFGGGSFGGRRRR